MAMPPRLTIVGDHERPDHSHLPKDARCYFWGEYTPFENTGGLKWNFSATNGLITNFKKKLDKGGQQYKRQAINEVAAAYAKLWKWDVLRQHRVALMPIPPSKARTDPLFDGRMHEMLVAMAAQAGGPFDIRDCLSFSGIYGASHEAAARPTPEDLYQQLAFDPVAGLAGDPPGLIMLFDDMLTTGAHFVAATRRLAEVFPESPVIGSFIARRVVPNPFDDFEDLSAL